LTVDCSLTCVLVTGGEADENWLKVAKKHEKKKEKQGFSTPGTTSYFFIG